MLDAMSAVMRTRWLNELGMDVQSLMPPHAVFFVLVMDEDAVGIPRFVTNAPGKMVLHELKKIMAELEKPTTCPTT